MNVVLWDAATGKQRLAVPVPDDVLSVAFAPGGKVFATAGQASEKKSPAGMVRLWDAATGGELTSFRVEAGPVRGVAFAPGGRLLAGGAADGTVRVWDVKARKEAAVLPGHQRPVMSVSFFPDGTGLVSGSQDGALKL